MYIQNKFVRYNTWNIYIAVLFHNSIYWRKLLNAWCIYENDEEIGHAIYTMYD